jgi:hypothetical protein
MNCEEIERKDILAAYITGKLPEAERDQFEEHFFGCEECLRSVEAARIARKVLVAQPVGRRAVHWWIPALAAAAVLVVGIAIWRTGSTQHRPEVAVSVVQPVVQPSYDLLAKFDAPGYRPATLRSAGKASKSFAAAMKLYSVGDFAAAAAGLRGIVGAEGEYYLGVSELLAGDRSGGIADLQKVIARGDTPYLSEGRFYLAKGLIGDGKLAEARVELEVLVKEKSELGPSASKLLAQLR